jgi:hypothetical protein
MKLPCQTELGSWRKYESLFTPFMRSHALTTKPQKYASQQGFRLTSYLIGPR